jgi:hypothetical protein
MPPRIVRFESTPNPTALKCWLDSTVSDSPRSFRSSEAAREHPLACRLFDEAGLTTLLLNGSWMTINKPPEVRWPAVKNRVQQVLAALGDL